MFSDDSQLGDVGVRFNEVDLRAKEDEEGEEGRRTRTNVEEVSFELKGKRKGLD